MTNTYFPAALATVLALGAVTPVEAAIRYGGTETTEAAKAVDPQAETVSPGEGTAGSGAELNDILVTATRRQTDVQHTPMAVDVLSGRTLEKIHAINIADYFTQVPGLTIQDQGPGQKRFVIRNLTAAGESEVGLYLDEIPIVGFTGENADAGSAQPDVRLWDVDRVEVLKGPQGTLYGSGSEGGSIRIISNKPDLTRFGGKLNADVSTFAGASGGLNYSQSGTVNIPIVTDKLAVRLSLYNAHDDGYIRQYYLRENKTNWVDTDGGRINVRFRPVDNWTIDFIAYLQKTNTGDLFNINPSYSAAAGTKWSGGSFVRLPTRDRFQAYNLISTTTFPWATLTAIASWQKRSMRYLHAATPDYDTDCRSGDFPTCYSLASFDQKIASGKIGSLEDKQSVSAWSAEVRLAAPDTSRLKWTLGFFYQKRENAFSLYSGKVDGEGYLVHLPDGSLQGQTFARANWDNTRQFAEFGEVTYPITSKLKVTGGIRIFQVVRSLTSLSIMPYLDYDAVPTYEPGASSSNHSLTGKALVSYDVNPHFMLYAQAAEGYRIGGPNAPIGFTANLGPAYRPDKVWDYEGGWKTKWLDNRLEFNGAIYRMVWSDIQQQGSDITGAYSYIVNAGSATATGFEAEIRARVTPKLLLEGGASYTDAHLVGSQPYEPLAVNQTRAGDKLPYVPDWTVNGSATYDFRVANKPAFVRWDFAYESGRTTAFDRVSPNFAKLKGWFLVNANIGVQVNRFDLSLFAKNILNKRTSVSGSLDTVKPLIINSTQPATVGFSISTQF